MEKCSIYKVPSLPIWDPLVDHNKVVHLGITPPGFRLLSFSGNLRKGRRGGDKLGFMPPHLVLVPQMIPVKSLLFLIFFIVNSLHPKSVPILGHIRLDDFIGSKTQTQTQILRTATLPCQVCNCCICPSNFQTGYLSNKTYAS